AVRSSGNAPSSGYRLTVFDAATLATLAEHRNTIAPNDPLTNCLLAYPGPDGVVGGDTALRYSLCSPTGQADDPALLIWNPFSGAVVKQIDLSGLADNDPSAVYGGATSDGKMFYAINTGSQRIVEIDLDKGKVVRDASFAAAPSADASSSAWDRFRNWLTGLAVSTARAGVLLDSGMAIAPGGQSIYVAAPGSNGNPSNGVLVIDTQTLKVSAHLLAGQNVAGLTVTAGGELIVRQPGSDGQDQIAVVSPAGQTVVTVRLAGAVNSGPNGR
ncbi:MAG TPA: hypothetical protein VKU87_04560, partial [Thermomicrobiaceae bacterium]|nr:hypothetical protein [Thermomicrobiaceae bacterium]